MIGGPRSRLVAAGLALVLVCSTQAVACPSPPDPVRDLDLPRFYGDAKGTRVDPEQAKRHAASREAVTAFVRHVTKEADAAVLRRDVRRGGCALDWLAHWATGEAWLGRMATRQAEYQRKWDLAGVAIAYLKLRSMATPDHRARIEPWLQRFTDAARAFFNDRGRRRNNHWYWLGLGAGATGLATGSARHWVLAREIMADAARDIGLDGTLPLELDRGRKALHYHVFSMMPLVAMAELALARGEDWYAMRGGALHRLVAVTARGLREPALFAQLAGKAQEASVKPGAGWLALYGAHFADRLPDRGLPKIATSHRWLGGDVEVLRDVLRDQHATFASGARE